MAKIETAEQLAAMCKKIAQEYETVYVLGAWGWPMTEAAQKRCMAEQAFNRSAERKLEIMLTDDRVFGFDCVGLIKGVLWGWDGDQKAVYGGAGYACNGVPDKNADQMIGLCSDVSEDFFTLQPGEVVWRPGHIGVYIGDGLAAECTYRWKDGVQLTAVHNIGEKPGYTGRLWGKHGKLPWVCYTQKDSTPLRTLRKGDKGEDVRALQILLAGNGCKGRMFEAGYGSFGSNTEEAVKRYQKQCGLPATGVADYTTWLHLLGREACA